VATQSGQAKVLVTSNVVADVRAFVRAHDVDTVVVLPLGQHPATVARYITGAIGQPSHVQGAQVWFDVQHRLETAAPGTHVPLALAVAPPATKVVRPRTDEEWQGNQLPAATATSTLGIEKVVFRITGEGRTFVETAGPSPYGYLARWDTTTDVNGAYAVQSVAYGDSGQVTTSASVVVQVRNP